MDIRISADKQAMARAAAEWAADGIRAALRERGRANVVVATGASQFEFLSFLVAAPGIAWGSVTAFHLDEYIGLAAAHPASFRGYLRERFQAKLPQRLAAFHEVNGESPDPAAECRRLGELIAAHPVDVSCIGIGENGHLAFNDPPADFEARDAYLVVALDEGCRRQQLGEGWFPTFDDVPRQAISMSIPQIMKARRIVCTVPDARKAAAVKGAVEGELTNRCPASVLRLHRGCALFLDAGAASQLSAAAKRYL
jgi:glucosamine-6-phosphate deaminase